MLFAFLTLVESGTASVFSRAHCAALGGARDVHLGKADDAHHASQDGRVQGSPAGTRLSNMQAGWEGDAAQQEAPLLGVLLREKAAGATEMSTLKTVHNTQILRRPWWRGTEHSTLHLASLLRILSQNNLTVHC